MGISRTRRKPLRNPAAVLRRTRGKRNERRLNPLIEPLVGVSNKEFKDAAKRGKVILMNGRSRIKLDIVNSEGVFQGIYRDYEGGLFSLRFKPSDLGETFDAMHLLKVEEGEKNVFYENDVIFDSGFVQISPGGGISMEIAKGVRKQGFASKMFEKSLKHHFSKPENEASAVGFDMFLENFCTTKKRVNRLSARFTVKKGQEGLNEYYAYQETTC